MRKCIVILLVCLGFQAATLADVGDIWDFNTELSFVNNPTIPGNPEDPNDDAGWAYGYAVDPELGSMVLPYEFLRYDVAATLGEAQTNFWIPAGDGGFNPSLYHNFTNADLYGCPMGKSALHPGPLDTGGNWASVARWIAPADEPAVKIEGTFYAGAPGRVSYFIVYNGGAVNADVIVQVLGSYDTIPFVKYIPNIKAGDTIDFIVGLYGVLGSNTTPLDATITSLTEIPAYVEDPVGADPWDFNEDMRITFGNPPSEIGQWQSPWSYGTADVIRIDPNTQDPGETRHWNPDTLTTAALTLYDAVVIDENDIPVWNFEPATAGLTPAIFKNTNLGAFYGCPAGKSALQPEYVADPNLVGSEAVSVARFTMPEIPAGNVTGKFFVQATFYTGAAGKVDCFVIKNGSSQIWRVLETTADAAFAEVMALQEGDMLDFVVGAADDTGVNDVTPLDVLIRNAVCADVEPMATDINQDCHVNLEDFAALAGNWLQCNDPQNTDDCN